MLERAGTRHSWRRSPAGLSAWDRRNAAMHEAGHLVIAHSLGMHDAFARIFENPNPMPCDKTWGGHCSFPAAGLAKKPAKARLMLYAAGLSAELAWAKQRDGCEPCLYDALSDQNSMSASDWAGTGCTPGEPSNKLTAAAEEVAEMFDPAAGLLWVRLNGAARQLMRAGYASCREPV